MRSALAARLALLALALPATAATHRVAAGAVVLTVNDAAEAVALTVAGESLLAGPRLASAQLGGEAVAATGLTVAGDEWTLDFAGRATARLAVVPSDGGIVCRLAAVTGAPTQVSFLELALRAEGAVAGPAGLVRWPETLAGVIAAGPQTLVKSRIARQAAEVSATADAAAGWGGVAVALIGGPADQAEALIAAAEQQFGIPLGITAKRAPANQGSYLMLQGITQQNAADVAGWAQRGGFGSVLMLHGS